MLCQATGALFDEHDLMQNNPMHCHYEDVCRWDCWGRKTSNGCLVSVHVYSWDRMTDCVKHGFELLAHRGDHNDYEVCAKSTQEETVK